MKKWWLFFTSIIVSLSLIACSYSYQKSSYYSEKSNYISASGTVRYIYYGEDYLYVALSEMSETFDDDHFKIGGKSYDAVVEKGIEKHLSVGTEITFVTAPKYFGDGYVMPMVSVTIDGVVFLEFEEGYNNLLQAI